MNKTLGKYMLLYPTLMLRGERVKKYFDEYIQTQYWGREEIWKYQLKKLKHLLSFANTHVPFYKDRLKDVEFLNIGSGECFQEIPCILKDDIRVNFREMLSTKKYFLNSSKTTGGSTGEAITIIKTRIALARERAATWRAYQWVGVDIGDLQGRFWGVPLTFQGRIKYRIIDLISNRIRLSAFNFDEKNMRLYYEKILKFKPCYLYGYVSMIEAFAKYLEGSNLKIPFELKCIISTSEILTEPTRQFLQKVFNCKVFNEYGCGEVGSIAHECPKGNMHIMSENLFVEILKGNKPVKEGEVGELVVTELNNFAMPLIRYRLGDFGEFTSEKCPCGRGLPFIRKIMGREYDMIKGSNGHLFHAEIFMYIFEEAKKKNLGIKQFQIIQQGKNALRIKLVPGDNFSQASMEYIKSYIRKLIDINFRVDFEMVESIPREPSGKMRLVKSIEEN